ncbi:MAG: hypothetical protein DRP74_08340 [Candidatus Omnitrophota bacterium]|nr:MAG: hypothetical protein DRP74_08340 [Candidatus Omnitrophota bacterium]
MKKVLFITFEYPISKSYCGGVGQIVEQSRDALLELGYEAYVLISSEFNRKRPVKLLLPDSSIKQYSSFNSYLKDYNWCTFSYIIHHFVNWTKDLKNLKKHKGRRPKIIYHFHSILRREKDSGFRTLNRFLYNQERMIELANSIICPSNYEYDNFIRYFPSFIDKVTVIENTIKSFPPDKNTIDKIREEYSIKPDDIVSLYVGRVERIKGAHIILNETPKVLRKHRRLKLFFVGRSLEKDLYKKLIRLRNKFPRQFFYKRYLERVDLFQYYYLSDIYINSSLSESFSLSTHESALCDNALLLNKLPVLEKFKGASLFFNAREEDFSYKFETLINNGDLRRKLSRKANIVVNRFLGNNKLKEDLGKLLCNFPHG